MRSQNWLRTLIIALTILSAACAPSLNRYYPRETSPRMIYVGDEVNGLRTRADLTAANPVYSEIRTVEGGKTTGLLVRITESDLVLNEGYYYSVVNDSLQRQESQRVIPKDDVLILKIW
jgi:hypothetical protein